MLPEGTLTVVCEIGGFKRISARSDFQRVRDQFDSSAFPDLANDLSSAFENMEHSDLKLRCGDQVCMPLNTEGGTRSDARFCHKFSCGFHWPVGHTVVAVQPSK